MRAPITRHGEFLAGGGETGALMRGHDWSRSPLGGRFAEVRSEIWGDILPMVERALAGEAVYHEDLPLTVHREGAAEQAYFTFCYSPLRDAAGTECGMFRAVAEPTSKVLSELELRRVNESLEAMVETRTRALRMCWPAASAI